jgi:hypothetical protein
MGPFNFHQVNRATLKDRYKAAMKSQIKVFWGYIELSGNSIQNLHIKAKILKMFLIFRN